MSITYAFEHSFAKKEYKNMVSDDDFNVITATITDLKKHYGKKRLTKGDKIEIMKNTVLNEKGKLNLIERIGNNSRKNVKTLSVGLHEVHTYGKTLYEYLKNIRDEINKKRIHKAVLEYGKYLKAHDREEYCRIIAFNKARKNLNVLFWYRTIKIKLSERKNEKMRLSYMIYEWCQSHVIVLDEKEQQKRDRQNEKRRAAYQKQCSEKALKKQKQNEKNLKKQIEKQKRIEEKLKRLNSSKWNI